jgi:hypothetical protein
LALQWSDVHLEPGGTARYGWLQVRDGKSKNAKRTVSLVARLASLLREKQKTARPRNGSLQVTTRTNRYFRKHHFPADLVLHSLRHTELTRLGAGADAFTIMKLAGRSSVTVSQRYVHQTGETVQLAFERLEAINSRALEASSGQW